MGSNRDLVPLIKSHKKRRKRSSGASLSSSRRQGGSRYGSRRTMKQPTIDEESVYTIQSGTVASSQHVGYDQDKPAAGGNEYSNFDDDSYSDRGSSRLEYAVEDDSTYSSALSSFLSRRTYRTGVHGKDTVADRLRRYLYAAITATFLFVIFQEIGVIEQVHQRTSLLISDAPSDLIRHRRESINPGGGGGSTANGKKSKGLHGVGASSSSSSSTETGSMASLAAAAASMAATSMHVPDSVSLRGEDSIYGSSGSMKQNNNGNDNSVMHGHTTYVSRAEMMEHVMMQDSSIEPGSRPVIHTFFEWIPPRNRGTQMSDVADKALIAEWKAAWKAAGWEPRVLTLEDAKKHPQYHDYAPTLNSIPMLGVDGLGGNVVYNQVRTREGAFCLLVFGLRCLQIWCCYCCCCCFCCCSSSSFSLSHTHFSNYGTISLCPFIHSFLHPFLLSLSCFVSYSFVSCVGWPWHLSVADT